MRRRELMILIGGAAVAALLAARAQPSRRRRIAMLIPGRGSADESEPFRQGLLWEGLRALGYGDEDITIETAAAEGHSERLADLAPELVRLAPEIIVAAGPAAVQAAKQATSTIPIVTLDIADPELVDVKAITIAHDYARLLRSGGMAVGCGSPHALRLLYRRGQIDDAVTRQWFQGFETRPDREEHQRAGLMNS